MAAAEESTLDPHRQTVKPDMLTFLWSVDQPPDNILVAKVGLMLAQIDIFEPYALDDVQLEEIQQALGNLDVPVLLSVVEANFIARALAKYMESEEAPQSSGHDEESGWTCNCGAVNKLSTVRCPICSVMQYEIQKRPRYTEDPYQGMMDASVHGYAPPSAKFPAEPDSDEERGGLTEAEQKAAIEKLKAAAIEKLKAKEAAEQKAQADKRIADEERRRSAEAARKEEIAKQRRDSARPMTAAERRKEEEEKRKAAILRLGKKRSLSPPAPCHFREKTDEERERERKREQVRMNQGWRR